MFPDGGERVVLPVNKGWEFVRGKPLPAWFSYDHEAVAEEVQLPHCWNGQDTFQDGVEMYRGFGGYRTCIELPREVWGKSDGIWELRSEGFYGTGSIWLQGQKRKSFDAEYLGVSIDVTSAIQQDTNLLVGVRLTNRCGRHVLPGSPMPDFLLYGGLAGRMELCWKPAVHIREHSIMFCTLESCDQVACVDVKFHVCNTTSHPWCGEACWSLLNSAVQPVARQTVSLNVAPHSTGLASMELAQIDQPLRWSLDNRYLYTLRCEVRDEDGLIDMQEVLCGIRTTEFVRGKGFLLNGVRVELRGCNRHESMPGFGNGLPLSQHREDARLLKKMGCNFVRLSHYPQHPEFLRECDKIGLLVYAELASWKSVRGGRWLKNAMRQMRRMMERDRNHPSVILWGLGNESRHQGAFARLHGLCKQLDPDRPTIYAENHLYRAKRRRTLNLTDVWGANYELNVLDEVKDYCSTGCVVVSECSNQPYAYRRSLSEMAKQIKQVDKDLKLFAGKPHVSGFALWSFNDYATLRKKRYARYCGVVDAWRSPKMVTAYLRCRYSKEPQLYLFGDWSAGKEGELRDVYVLSNGMGLSWCLDQGAAPLSNTFFQQVSVPFTNRDLAARAWVGETEVEACLEVHGKGVRLRIDVGDMDEDGYRVATITVVDKEGKTDRTWSGVVHVQADSPVVVVSYRADDAIPVDAGVGRVWLRCTDQLECFRVTGQAVGLDQADASVSKI